MTSAPPPTRHVGPYGPNSESVERFLAGLRALSFLELGRSIAAWRSSVNDAWHDAEDAVSDALAATERHDERRRALEALYDVFREQPWFSRRKPDSLVPGSDAAAQYVATTALYALVVSDRITAEQLALLLSPYEGLIDFAAHDS